MKIKSLTIAILSSIMLVSCMGLKPSGSTSAENLFETFFVGEQGTQYYIKPLTYTSNLNHAIAIDYTFRYKDEVKDTCVANMSFFHTNIIKQIDSIKIVTPSNTIKITEFDLMFNEKTKKGFLSRITAKSPLVDINSVFKNTNWRIDYYNNGVPESFLPTKKTLKSTQKLIDNIFVLF